MQPQIDGRWLPGHTGLGAFIVLEVSIEMYTLLGCIKLIEAPPPLARAIGHIHNPNRDHASPLILIQSWGRGAVL